MVLLHSNFAAVATTADWTEAVKSGEALPASNLVISAAQGNEAARPTARGTMSVMSSAGISAVSRVR